MCCGYGVLFFSVVYISLRLLPVLWFVGSYGVWDSTPQREGDKRSLYMSIHLFVTSVYLSLLLVRTCLYSAGDLL